MVVSGNQAALANNHHYDGFNLCMQNLYYDIVDSHQRRVGIIVGSLVGGLLVVGCLLGCFCLVMCCIMRVRQEQKIFTTTQVQIYIILLHESRHIVDRARPSPLLIVYVCANCLEKVTSSISWIL